MIYSDSYYKALKTVKNSPVDKELKMRALENIAGEYGLKFSAVWLDYELNI